MQVISLVPVDRSQLPMQPLGGRLALCLASGCCDHDLTGEPSGSPPVLCSSAEGPQGFLVSSTPPRASVLLRSRRSSSSVCPARRDRVSDPGPHLPCPSVQSALQPGLLPRAAVYGWLPVPLASPAPDRDVCGDSFHAYRMRDAGWWLGLRDFILVTDASSQTADKGQT